MPHDREESLPRCLFCEQRREGQRYTFWGGTHLYTKERRAFLSSTTTITSEYRDMKRVGAFVCRQCARRIVGRASWMTIAIATLCAIGCAAAAYFFYEGVIIRWGAIAGTALAALVAVAYLGMSLFPNLDSWTSDAIIRDRAAPLLKSKGKGDSFFTEREYEVLFTTKPADRPETAEELLEGIEDEEVRPRKARRADAGPLDITRCPACGKATPASKKCKWCHEPLP
jgi:hypothetical protein